MQQELGYPVAVAFGREQARAIGAWWDDEKGIVQPAEFILRRDGTVVSATYSTGPIGRMDAGDALKVVKMLGSRS